MPRLVVIGGMAAGMSAASKLKRLRPEWSVLVLEAGPDPSYGACGLPYLLGGEVRDADDLLALSPDEIAARGIQLRLRQRVTTLQEGRKQVEVEDLPSGRFRTEAYDALLIATGASAAPPDLRGLSGENLFTLHDLGDGRRMSAFLDAGRPRSALVWGTGYIGIEVAENLARRGLAVTLINRSERVLKSLCPVLRERVVLEIEENGVRLLLATQVLEVLSSGNRIVALETDRGRLPADLFVVATGIRPNTEFLAGSPVPLDLKGAIVVDEACATGTHGIWAAGDCCAVPHRVTGRPTWMPLGTTANKMGRVAGANIAGERERFPGVVGTAITRVFALEVGRSGLSFTEAVEAGFDAEWASITSHSRAGYFPGGGEVRVSLVADRRSERLLGGQVAGAEGTKGRTDTLAAAVTAGMKVQDLLNLDLAYAPSFAPVWDPLLVAAGALRAKLSGR